MESIKINNELNNYWKCGCGGVLGKFNKKIEDPVLYQSIIDIKGVNGNEYEMGYTVLKAICGKCGKSHIRNSPLLSDVSSWEEYETMMLVGVGMPPKGHSRTGELLSELTKSNNPFKLQSFWRNRLLPKLTKKQKIIYSTVSNFEVLNQGVVDLIAKKIKLSSQVIWNDLKKIWKIIQSFNIPKEELTGLH